MTRQDNLVTFLQDMEKASIRNTYQSILIRIVAISILFTLLSLKASIKEVECFIIGGGRNHSDRQP